MAEKKAAQITRQRTGKLVRALFEILLEHPDGIQARAALDALEQRVPPTDYESGHFPSGGRRYEHIVRFSTVDLVKAGWMLKDKGIWSATEIGKAAFDELSDPTAFYKRAVELYHAWKAAQPKSAESPADEESADIKVQVKRRKDNIAVDELRSFMAVLGEDDVGLFVTTGGFTKDAKDEARLQEKRKITLIDRERLVELWIEYMDRIGEDVRRLLPLRPIYFLAPA
jgi:hypothetical protein